MFLGIPPDPRQCIGVFSGVDVPLSSTFCQILLMRDERRAECCIVREKCHFATSRPFHLITTLLLRSANATFEAGHDERMAELTW